MQRNATNVMATHADPKSAIAKNANRVRGQKENVKLTRISLVASTESSQPE
jgi:hypothetical protein